MEVKHMNGYSFKGIEYLFADEKGNFFYKEKTIKKYWRAGQVYILIDKKRYGMNTLRKISFKSLIKEIVLPF